MRAQSIRPKTRQASASPPAERPPAGEGECRPAVPVGVGGPPAPPSISAQSVRHSRAAGAALRSTASAPGGPDGSIRRTHRPGDDEYPVHHRRPRGQCRRFLPCNATPDIAAGNRQSPAPFTDRRIQTLRNRTGQHLRGERADQRCPRFPLPQRNQGNRECSPATRAHTPRTHADWCPRAAHRPE